MAGPNVILRIVTRAHALSTGEPRTKSVYNVYDFRRTTTGGAPSKTAAVTKFKTDILTPLQAVLSVSYVTDYIDCRWLDDPLDPFVTAALALNGTVAGDSLPSINNVRLRLTTGLRGGSYRGAKLYGPIAESQTLLDSVTAGAIALWGTFSVAYLAGFTASDGYIYQPYLVSQKKSVFKLAPPTATVVGTIINGTTLNTIVGRLQRRNQLRRSSV